MTNKPEKKKGESNLAYYLRLAEWEREYKVQWQKEAASIDTALARANVRHEHAVSKQVQQDRRTMHELAENNPILRNVLRRMQK